MSSIDRIARLITFLFNSHGDVAKLFIRKVHRFRRSDGEASSYPTALRKHFTLDVVEGFLLVIFAVGVIVYNVVRPFIPSYHSDTQPTDYAPTIIVITPTYQRPERLGDLTMLGQTLMQVPRIFWVVVEDGNQTVSHVERLLNRTSIPYVYLAEGDQGLPCRGWAHRNFAMQWLRENRQRFSERDVVYFADDDNAYDIRLFTEYIVNVKVLGVWGVGTSASALVETPRVRNGKVIGWDVLFRPNRKFATDMAGFAVSLGVLLRSNATFHIHCAGIVPEECFLNQLQVSREQLEPFGFDKVPHDIVVWHRTVHKGDYRHQNQTNYVVEERRQTPERCRRMLNIIWMSFDEVLEAYRTNLKGGI